MVRWGFCEIKFDDPVISFKLKGKIVKQLTGIQKEIIFRSFDFFVLFLANS